MTAPRVLFLLKWRPCPYDGGGEGGYSHCWGDHLADPGKPMESGLYNSARMARDMLERLGVTCALAHVVDANAIHREAVAFAATHVVIEAFWVPPAKFDELARVLPGVAFIVRNHSETPFLANEGMAFEWSLEYFRRANVAVAPNSPRMLAEMRYLARQVLPRLTQVEIAARIPCLPNYYGLREEPPRPLDPGKGHVDVGCFGAIRPLKNQVLQAFAAMSFADGVGKALRFHVNGARVETGGDPVIRSLRAIFAPGRHQLVEHPWLGRADFLTLILSMDLVTQVSFSETFCIVAADAAGEGVPVVASAEVPWSAPMLRAEPASSRQIAAKMALAYRLKSENPAFNPGLDGLRDYNARARRKWADYFTGP